MQELDTVLPFQFEKSDVKGRIGIISNSVRQILKNKDYPPMVACIVAEACILTALIGQSMELKWKLSLQIRGKGPLRLIASDYFNFGTKDDSFSIRCHSSFDQSFSFLPNHEFRNLMKDGYFAVIIDEGAGKEPYQGITPLIGNSLSECAESFFHQSEQLPTRFSIKVDENTMNAGGIMLQYLAKGSEAIRHQELTGESLRSSDFLSGSASEDWKRVNTFLNTLGSDELFEPKVSKERLLYRLFNEESPTVQSERKIAFGCTCSPKKVKQTMSIYSSNDIKKMTNEVGKVTAECQFCGAKYSFNPKELGMEADCFE